MSDEPLEATDVLSLIYDAHCHVHLDQSIEGRERAQRLLNTIGGASVMATGDQDWDQALEAAGYAENAHCHLGIHPWFAHRYAGQIGWLEALKERLIESPQLSVGEIGLDKKWRSPEGGKVEYEAQLEVFQAQLQLAGELCRPISVHCVKAQGALFKTLDEASLLPPTIYLHAYGGAPETVKQLLRSKRFGDRLYFGFAACVNLRSPKTRATIEAVPADRLLLESDRSSARKPIVDELLHMLSLYAEIKGWSSVEIAAQLTTENARRCYLMSE